MAGLKTYVKLKDTSTTLIDPKTKIKISGKKPFEVDVTPMIQKAIAANVLVQMNEDVYKKELAAWNKLSGNAGEVPSKPVVTTVIPPVAPEKPVTPPADKLPLGTEPIKENGTIPPVTPPEKTAEEYTKEYTAMKGEDLIALASEKGVDITGLKTKAEIAAKLVTELHTV